MGMHAAMAGFDYTQKSQENIWNLGAVFWPFTFMGTVASDKNVVLIQAY